MNYPKAYSRVCYGIADPNSVRELAQQAIKSDYGLANPHNNADNILADYFGDTNDALEDVVRGDLKIRGLNPILGWATNAFNDRFSKWGEYEPSGHIDIHKGERGYVFAEPCVNKDKIVGYIVRWKPNLSNEKSYVVTYGANFTPEEYENWLRRFNNE